MSAEEPGDPPSVDETPRGRFPWRFPTVVVALAIVVSWVGRQFVDQDNSFESLVSVLSCLVAFLTLSIWWLFFCGLAWSTRIRGVGLVLGLLAVFLVLFRFEGQAGNFIPQFSFRFTPSSEERALEYFSRASPQPDVSSPSADDQSLADLVITEEDWPKFGGPRGDHTVSESVRTDWAANPPRELWRHPIGPGWSSFAVVGDMAFTQEQRGELECVVCYDVNTGSQVWLHEDEARFEEAAGGAGPRSTPTIFDSRLYALGATGILNCLDPQTGMTLWSTNIVEDNGGELIEWADAGSPTVHGDLLLVNPGTTTSFLAAYDRLTGEHKWTGPTARAGYATPLVASIAGESQVLAFHGEGVGAYSLSSGEELWMFPWTNVPKINASQPLVLPDSSVFISTGYGAGSVLLDVAQADGDWTVSSRWERPNKFKLKFNGGILADGFVYGLDEGILSCFDLSEGKRTWKKGRYQFGQILRTNTGLLVLTEKGKVVLVDATPESMSEVAEFQAIEGKTWNHPVLNRGRLLVRNAQEVACYDLSSE